MGKTKGFRPSPHTAFADAEAYIAKGRNKHSRPLQKNTYLARVDEDTIAVVLHYTAVVTYHRAGHFTIYGGGWNTVTTKDRIRGWSPAHPGSDGKGGWIVGYTGETTPPRVTKCRSCRGRGRWMEDDHCHPSYCGPDGYSTPWCDGARTLYAVDWNYGRGEPDNWDEHYASRYEAPCEHGNLTRHLTRPCEHRIYGQHVTGQSERTCYRCEGEGRCDYGSRPIPITVTADTPYMVDAEGQFLSLASDAPYAPSKSAPGHYSKPKKPDPYTYGGEIVDRLAKVIPDIRGTVRHPIHDVPQALNAVIVDLNDAHGWSRERIADWLDTLDLDLRFPTERNAA